MRILSFSILCAPAACFAMATLASSEPGRSPGVSRSIPVTGEPARGVRDGRSDVLTEAEVDRVADSGDGIMHRNTLMAIQIQDALHGEAH